MKPNQNTIQIRCPVCRQMDNYRIGDSHLICTTCGADLNNPQRAPKRTFPEPPPVQQLPGQRRIDYQLERRTDPEKSTGRTNYFPGSYLKKLLHTIMEQNAPMRLFTTNGVIMDGTLRSFDDLCLVIDKNDGERAIVMRSAVSTIIPAKGTV